MSLGQSNCFDYKFKVFKEDVDRSDDMDFSFLDCDRYFLCNDILESIFSYCERGILLECLQVNSQWYQLLCSDRMGDVWLREYKNGMVTHGKPDSIMIRQSETGIIQKNRLITQEHITKIRKRLIPFEISIFLLRYLYLLVLPIVGVTAGCYSVYMFLNSTSEVVNCPGSFRCTNSTTGETYFEKKIKDLDCLKPIYMVVLPTIGLILASILFENYYFYYKQNLWRTMAKRLYGIVGPRISVIPIVQFFPLYLMINILLHIVSFILSFCLVVYLHYEPSHTFYILIVNVSYTCFRYSILKTFGVCFHRMKREEELLSKFSNLTQHGDENENTTSEESEEGEIDIVGEQQEQQQEEEEEEVDEFVYDSNTSTETGFSEEEEEEEGHVIDEEIEPVIPGGRRIFFFQFHKAAKVALLLTDSSIFSLFLSVWMKYSFWESCPIPLVCAAFLASALLLLVAIVIHERIRGKPGEKLFWGFTDFSVFLVMNVALGWVALASALLCALPKFLYLAGLLGGPTYDIVYGLGLYMWVVLHLRYPATYIVAYAFLFERGCFLMEPFWKDNYLAYPIHDYLTLQMMFKINKSNISNVWGSEGYNAVCGVCTDEEAKYKED